MHPTDFSNRRHPLEPGRTIVLWIYQRVEQVKDESTPGNHQLQGA